MKILDVLPRYDVEVVKQGNIYVGYCPFHTDVNRPNFTVYPHTNSWFCFTCSKGGDAIFFVSLLEGITRQQAEARIYDNLQYLISKLSEEKKDAPCNDVINLQVSKMMRRYLQSHPDALPDVKRVMKEVDAALARDLSIKEGISIVTHVSSRLSHIQSS